MNDVHCVHFFVFFCVLSGVLAADAVDLIKQIGNTGAAMNGAVIKEKIVVRCGPVLNNAWLLGRRTGADCL